MRCFATSGACCTTGSAPSPARSTRCTRFRAERRPGRAAHQRAAPAPPIREQLQSLNVPDDAYDALVTSGDVTRNVIAARPGVRVLHVGPDRDLPLLRGARRRAGRGSARRSSISCTGLFDDNAETPEDYRALFERLVARGLPMVCANPDIVVERGGTARLLRRRAGAPLCASSAAGDPGRQAARADLRRRARAGSAASAARRRSPSATASRPTSAAPSTTACRALCDRRHPRGRFRPARTSRTPSGSRRG